MDLDKLSRGIVALAQVMARLRHPEGCPWDAKQDDTTVRMYLLEEAYEVLEAVERRSPDEVCQELGDLLFQIVFLAQLAQERGEFDLSDVVERIHRKMLYRHPHVFGDAKVKDAEEVATNWARLKMAEKDRENASPSSLSSVPRALPALLRAHRLLQRAAETAPDGESLEEKGARIRTEMEDLLDPARVQELLDPGPRLGRLLFDLVGLARHHGFNAEDLLRGAIQEFLARIEPGPRGKLEGLQSDDEPSSFGEP